ncbi:S8 family serine peptidase [Neorhizobium galegae]|uniref:S8 family serine peptidase n=1 Tax=Neorhizobium galegae TaxID=399 RepID=UPI0006214F35|nr:S8 family serine peptidase [Neorhizobium galegae]CDZ29099.1 Peptidase S8 and S53 subtilisin kexin sedolisin [Neorhizobium galegae bv. officinalis]MCM2498642.1 S8 family serine peptidase [Neorhizobium galegae]MCQ1774417.1 S8 family serine peptidase [Neorhizobium galegae]MCQ1775621.1 S8 family serine peptidase [Neorhizobium galegae]MCQ1798111.1 S8 family serine peptidase [Neorhizobium galegae]
MLLIVKIKPLRLLAAAIAAVAFAVLPLRLNDAAFTVPIAIADDDDGDDGGEGGGSNGGGDGNGSNGYHRGGNALRDLRSLFRWPSRERRAAVRRPAAVPEHVENELVTVGLGEDALAGLIQEGFTVNSRARISLIDEEMVRLIVPRGMTLEAARAAVAVRDTTATVDLNHFYQPESDNKSGCAGKGCTLVREIVGWPKGDTAGCVKPHRIGLIDTAINADHVSLANSRLEVIHLDEGEGKGSGAQHGTAVAALLVGGSDSRVPGLLPGAELIAVDAFKRTEGSTDIASIYDLVRALDLLVQRDVRVINLSLTGPANAVLETTVKAAAGRGVILVAAAGNDGPNAKPVYPAAYDDTIAVTAVDKGRNPYRRAVRGDYIDIAAPGVGVWTAASITGARQKTGTSFAAPFVTAAVSVLIANNPGMSLEGLEAKIRQFTDDIGEPGRDRVFGWGLLNARRLCDGENENKPSTL